MKFGKKSLSLSGILAGFETTKNQLVEFCKQESATIDSNQIEIERLTYDVDNRLDEVRKAQAAITNINKLLGED